MKNTCYYQTISTIIGELTLVCDDEAITMLRFGSEYPKDGIHLTTELLAKAIGQLQEYFEGSRKVFDVPLKSEGTPFQKKVWDVLKTIPYGETKSYSEVAMLTQNPKACRAVGMANNKNPIAIFIPCHRVIGKNGDLTGFGGGLNIKEMLLKREGAI